MKLYEFAPTRSIRARWALQELDVPFEAVEIKLLEGAGQTPEYLALNPTGKVPTLVDGDFVVTESVAIVVYLAEKYPEKALLPTDIKQRTQLNRWMLFIVTELEQPMWRIARNSFLYPEEQRQPTDIEIAKGEFRTMAAVLEKHMQGREFLVGDKVSVGDFIAAYTLDWGNEVGLLDQCPTLLAYMQRMYDRPKAAMRIKDALQTVQAA
ncbi:glutathione S-transferase [Steroidobacter agaridevorans]|uniref:Glutathione S-transferase n=1 Tax=Steroidobacter agaridevorans TaxID=2695856 RepID=A0A829YGM7_9GAMM|nr:glutathione S-transferase family protein [Steroidobacter agaridevorans]GFE82645.1 glutathione S-transferase [Steroidobacter agaridevorans]GFE85732.1 glutathione S-transferase [Steroidobacter agaridevorans]